MEMLNVIKKLTVKELGIDGARVIEGMDYGQVAVVARIYGRADKYKTSVSKFSSSDLPREDHKFIGNFEGVNLATGEVFNAPTCFLPGAAPETLAAALDAAGEPVEFVIEIGIKKIKKKDGTDGYSFGVALPRDPEQADALARVREQAAALPGAVKPLPAIEPPKAEPKKAKKDA